MMNEMNLGKNFAMRKGERGAALITSIMISTLLLTVAGTVILTSSLSATTAIESTSELQAYYGAESGLEGALNVLRGNVAPRSGMPTGIKMGFRNAVSLNRSNLPSDSSPRARLSGWLPYGSDGRVTPSGTNFAYSVVVTDPDDPTGATMAGDATYRPNRLVIQSTGFGPRGAVKRMEMVVQKTEFNFNPEAMLLMRGAEDGSPMSFDIGNSNAKFLTRDAYAGSHPAPTPFGL
jgi:hypothetical protein